MTTIAIPTDAAELEEMLNDTKKLEAIVNDGGIGEFVQSYVKASAKKDTDLQGQIDEAVQRGLTDFLKAQRETGAETPLDLSPELVRARNDRSEKIYNSRAVGAELDNVFTDASEFFRAAWHNSHKLRDYSSLQDKIAKATEVQNSFGSTVPADGGFLIPETMRADMLSVALESAVVRPRAMTIPMDSLRVPIPTIDDTSHVSSVFGGIVAYWTEEAAALVESQASFGRVVLEAKKLTCYSEVPNELISDAIAAFGAFLSQSMPAAVSYFEDVAFISGSGVGEPLGVLNAPGAVAVTRAASGNAIDWPDVVALYSRMLPTSLNRAVWLVTPDNLPSLLTMTYASGAPVAVWLPGGQAFDAPILTLLGRPVIITEKVPASGTAGDFDFVDFGYYLLGDRQAMQVASSPHYKFQNDKTVYRVIERVDGRPWLNSAITPKNGGATLSPIVTLS